VRNTSRQRVSLRSLASRVGLLFSGNARSEAVETALHLHATPEEVWQGILFYEDVPHRPLWFLRIFLPRPIRSDGEKTRVGAIVRCTYDSGHLLKRITAVEPAHLMRFDVLELVENRRPPPPQAPQPHPSARFLTASP
jgi:hypothetical protein